MNVHGVALAERQHFVRARFVNQRRRYPHWCAFNMPGGVPRDNFAQQSRIFYDTTLSIFKTPPKRKTFLPSTAADSNGPERQIAEKVAQPLACACQRLTDYYAIVYLHYRHRPKFLCHF